MCLSWLRPNLSLHTPVPLLATLADENPDKKKIKIKKNADLLSRQSLMGQELAFLKEQITTLWQHTSISEPHKDLENVSQEKETNCSKSNEAGLAPSDPARF